MVIGRMCKLLTATTQRVKSFCGSAGKSLETFRYFNSRPFTIISNNLVTYVLTHDDKEVAYGHLDVEEGHTWLGICVGEKYLGQGYGKEMIHELLTYADLKGASPILLSVDKDNLSAISLYNKVGFVTTKTTESVYYMRREVTYE